MHFTKKWFLRPLYKKLLQLKTTPNTNKIAKFNKLKWQRFKHFVLKKKIKNSNPVTYFLSSFNFFFSKKFKHNLQNKQRLSFYYGKLRKSYLKTITKSALKKSKKLSIRPSTFFIQKLEARLDTALYRTHFCPNRYTANQIILHEKIYVNNKIIKHRFFQLKKGDLVTIDQTTHPATHLNVSYSKMWPVPPKHFYINYKTLQILVIENIKYSNCYSYYSFWINFNSFIRHYSK